MSIRLPAADLPCFLDVEASSFAAESYPIELAWSDPSGEIRRFLIKPLPEWTDWSSDSEGIHGIERGRVERNGWPVDYIAERLVEDLAGRTVYTDAPAFDSDWVERLFQAVGQPVPCHFDHVDELLIKRMRQPNQMIFEVMADIDDLKRAVKSVAVGKHSAGYDVGYLLQLWRAANGEAVKMNHGVGPLPRTTNTGTFIRVKRPDEERSD